MRNTEISGDWPFAVVHISPRRCAVAKVITFLGDEPGNYRGLGFYSLQIVGGKDERFSSSGDAVNYAAKLTIEYLMKKLGDTPARDAHALRLGMQKLSNALAHFGRHIDSSLIEKAEELMSDCERMAEIATTFKKEDSGDNEA